MTILNHMCGCWEHFLKLIFRSMQFLWSLMDNLLCREQLGWCGWIHHIGYAHGILSRMLCIIFTMMKWRMNSFFFLYDCCSIEDIERKWLALLDKHKVTNKDSLLYQMHEMSKIRCAVYHAGKCYLGLRSNQRSESVNNLGFRWIWMVNDTIRQGRALWALLTVVKAQFRSSIFQEIVENL